MDSYSAVRYHCLHQRMDINNLETSLSKAKAPSSSMFLGQRLHIYKVEGSLHGSNLPFKAAEEHSAKIPVGMCKGLTESEGVALRLFNLFYYLKYLADKKNQKWSQIFRFSFL